jgi:hypothetical protein
MKTMMIAALAALSLSATAAYAQGGPVGYQEPVYGSQAFADHRNEPVAHFLGKDTVLGKLFDHSNSGRTVADRTAVTSAHGG